MCNGQKYLTLAGTNCEFLSDVSGMVEPRGPVASSRTKVRSIGITDSSRPVSAHCRFTEDRATLVSLRLTSRSFKFEAGRVLDHSMTLPEGNVSSHLRFLQTITNVERLALLVHTYHFLCLDVRVTLSHLVLCGLKVMVNLRYLRLRGRLMGESWKVVAWTRRFMEHWARYVVILWSTCGVGIV